MKQLINFFLCKKDRTTQHSFNESDEWKVFQPYEKLFHTICDSYALNLSGVHGVKHWVQVYKNTQLLANTFNISSDVFALFALLHDSKREDEYEDFEHGIRAATSIQNYLKEGLIELSKEDEARLLYACANHTCADKENPLYRDLIVQICLDSDKLDIGRVGVIPHESHFLTNVSKGIVKKLKGSELNF